jgi:transposase-like protein
MGDSVSADALQRFRLIRDTPQMRELSEAEQRYQAVMAVIGDGLTVSQAAEKTGVARQTLHRWLARYEAEGLDGLADRSHQPVSCPHQMPAAVEAATRVDFPESSGHCPKAPVLRGGRQMCHELAFAVPLGAGTP